MSNHTTPTRDKHNELLRMNGYTEQDIKGFTDKNAREIATQVFKDSAQDAARRIAAGLTPRPYTPSNCDFKREGKIEIARVFSRNNEIQDTQYRRTMRAAEKARELYALEFGPNVVEITLEDTATGLRYDTIIYATFPPMEAPAPAPVAPSLVTYRTLWMISELNAGAICCGSFRSLDNARREIVDIREQGHSVDPLLITERRETSAGVELIALECHLSPAQVEAQNAAYAIARRATDGPIENDTLADYETPEALEHEALYLAQHAKATNYAVLFNGQRSGEVFATEEEAKGYCEFAHEMDGRSGPNYYSVETTQDATTDFFYFDELPAPEASPAPGAPQEMECPKCGNVWAPAITETATCPQCHALNFYQVLGFSAESDAPPVHIAAHAREKAGELERNAAHQGATGALMLSQHSTQLARQLREFADHLAPLHISAMSMKARLLLSQFITDKREKFAPVPGNQGTQWTHGHSHGANEVLDELEKFLEQN